MKTICMNYTDSIMFFICFQKMPGGKNPFMVAERVSELSPWQVSLQAVRAYGAGGIHTALCCVSHDKTNGCRVHRG